MKSTRILTLIFFAASLAWSRDCTKSPEFEITQEQPLAGTLFDVQGAYIAIGKLELLPKHGKRVAVLENKGTYDFGTIPPGRYRLRFRTVDKFYCAPAVQCSAGICKLSTNPQVNPNNDAPKAVY